MRPYVNITGLNNLSHQGLAQPDGVKVRYGSVPTIQLEDGLEEVKEEDGSVKRSLPKLPEFQVEEQHAEVVIEDLDQPDDIEENKSDVQPIFLTGF
jgi:hypothetical protein